MEVDWVLVTMFVLGLIVGLCVTNIFLIGWWTRALKTKGEPRCRNTEAQ